MKIQPIVLAVLLLTACTAERKDGEFTETSATTPLTLTESITTERIYEFPTEEKEQRSPIEFAVFSPREDAVKVDGPLYGEIIDAVVKSNNGRTLLYASANGFDMGTSWADYCDEETVLEENADEGYFYMPFSTEIASTSDELKAYLRQFFTEDFISDDEMEETLFTAQYGDAAPYRIIDGQLAVRNQYTGLFTRIYTDGENLLSMECDGNRAKVIAVVHDGGYPSGLMAFAEYVRCDEYGWRLDKLEIESNSTYKVNCLYNAVALRTDKLNEILGGGNTPENAKTITSGKYSYTETDLDMSIEEMQDFFAESFDVNNISHDSPKVIQLRRTYTIRYIEDVYLEEDGVLYRRDDKPRWYLPQIKPDPYSADVKFEDLFTGEVFEYDVSATVDSMWDEDAGKEVFYAVYISSELPIREKEGDSQ